MSFWSSLFGGKRDEPERPGNSLIWLAGNDEFDFEIVGESNYQANLEAICGGRTDEEADHLCIAFLVPEPHNQYDSNAVRVDLTEGDDAEPRAVGYLSRANAEDYHARMADLRLARRVACCRALVVGGWDRGGRGKGHFGVKLDLVWPVERGELGVEP